MVMDLDLDLVKYSAEVETPQISNNHPLPMKNLTVTFIIKTVGTIFVTYVIVYGGSMLSALLHL